MRNPSSCAARDPLTCRYHGTVIHMDQAIAENDPDAYLIYKTRVEELEKQPNPESFFDPTNEAEEIVSAQQLTKLIHRSQDGALPRPYFAEFQFNGNMLAIYGKRYRNYAKKHRLNFTEKKSRGSSTFTITANTHADLRHIRIILEDGQYHVDEQDIQAAGVAAAR